MNTATIMSDTKKTPRKAKNGPYYEAGRFIKDRRLELGLSQNELAQRYGASQGYISSIERGWENLLNASAVFYERMGAALEMDAFALMNALGVEFSVARNLDGRQSSISPVSEISHSGYVTVVIKVKNRAPQLPSTERTITLPSKIAEMGEAHGYRYEYPTVDVVPAGVDVVYISRPPQPDDLVVFEVALPEGQTEIHVGYFNGPDSVELDQPISKLLPLVVRPLRILGVVQSFVATAQPRRQKLN
ncbi:helix-turn-helix domain-containing protein [Deinococcus sp. Marseille-Q6407]|uniref:helix-turn-helix domain-containing protein n=1 Tax=Deinococcus sp. Marseille-Q6407 TaxID=2969223 RepID=UPI0021BF15C6|nr:helix-turn-helix transcriptional regulator [Deinococcus sp. Marseille-Q6407]